MPWRRLFKRRRTNAEIAPDEIFLDASNIPAFDTDQFEGRIERPIERKSFVFLGIMFALVLLVYGGRAGMLQIVQGKEYAELSEKNRLAQSYISQIAERSKIAMGLSLRTTRMKLDQNSRGAYTLHILASEQ